MGPPILIHSTNSTSQPQTPVMRTSRAVAGSIAVQTPNSNRSVHRPPTATRVGPPSTSSSHQKLIHNPTPLTSRRYHPYEPNISNMTRPQSTPKTPAFQVSNDLFSPKPTPIIISRRTTPKSRSTTPWDEIPGSPLLGRSHGIEHALTTHHLGSPIDLPASQPQLFNPAKRLDFSSHPPNQSPEAGPSTGYYSPPMRLVGRTLSGSYIYESRSGRRFETTARLQGGASSSSPAGPVPASSEIRVSAMASPEHSRRGRKPTPSQSQGTQIPSDDHEPSPTPVPNRARVQPQHTPVPITLTPLPPRYVPQTPVRLNTTRDDHTPTQTPINDLEAIQHHPTAIPVLDGALQDVLDGILRGLQGPKCPLCYYQGIDHHHAFAHCPINAQMKLGNQNDAKFERWKGEVFVATKNTHCWSCFIPTLVRLCSRIHIFNIDKFKENCQSRQQTPHQIPQRPTRFWV
ncbi:hypothetical protein P691DRAFT_478022 [Macrolepiota fuliginosa MF-IS2]|uniref:Uncharacterized protein n=1 Tax=Macrolepiota fuliginosa MF-IS2 TaxID=1400762 RepID=A0A9P5X339_9AGAR|nr:hypothetical protein P691DRAFT_478022 [Macrolepiota fuliginosa MF-IS2]